MKLLIAICSIIFLLSNTINAQEQGKNIWEKSKTASGKSKGKIKEWKTHLNNSKTDSTFRKALAIAGRLNTNGWTAGLQYQHKIDSKTKSTLELLFSEIRHEKELKQERTGKPYDEYGVILRPYYFGKVNHLYTLQLGYGREHTLFPSLIDGNLSVSIQYAGGVTVAVTKPVYLHLLYTNVVDTTIIYEIKTEKWHTENQDVFLNHNRVISRDKWKRGLGELSYTPGVYFATSLTATPEWAGGLVQRFSVGGQISLFLKPITLLANHEPNRVYACLYVSMDIGKRW